MFVSHSFVIAASTHTHGIVSLTLEIIPSGNILTSAAILYTGSLPSKALHIFQTLNCASISQSTFFRHQSCYLQPAISSVWIHHQQKLLSTFKENNVKLHVGGDDRADSPGHSAKYGTYSVLELT